MRKMPPRWLKPPSPSSFSARTRPSISLFLVDQERFPLQPACSKALPRPEGNSFDALCCAPKCSLYSLQVSSLFPLWCSPNWSRKVATMCKRKVSSKVSYLCCNFPLSFLSFVAALGSLQCLRVLLSILGMLPLLQ